MFCPPTYFDVLDVKNPFMSPETPVDKGLAQHQWEQVVRAFEEAGLPTHVLPAVEQLEDMTFANNQVFVGVAPRGGCFIVPSRMRHASRQLEVPCFVAWFRSRGYRVLELDFDSDDYLEGHGDLLWQPDFSFVWAGHGFRSSRGGVERFAAAVEPLGVRAVPLELVDPTFYHLDTCLAPLNREAVLIHPGAFSSQALERIHNGCARVYEIERADALRFVCNGVAVGQHFLTAWSSPYLERILREEGLKPILLDTSEFEKSGGSVCCLKLLLPQSC